MYKLKGHSEVAMTHTIEIPCELWHRRRYHTYAKLSQVYQNSRLTMKACAMDVHKGRTSRTLFRRETAKQKES